MLTLDQMYALGVWAISYVLLRPLLMLQSVAIPLGMAAICILASFVAELVISDRSIWEIVTLRQVAAATASGVGLGFGLVSVAAERAIRNALKGRERING